MVFGIKATRSARPRCRRVSTGPQSGHFGETKRQHQQRLTNGTQITSAEVMLVHSSAEALLSWLAPLADHRDVKQPPRSFREAAAGRRTTKKRFVALTSRRMSTVF